MYIDHTDSHKFKKIDPKKTNYDNSIKVSFYYITDDNYLTKR